MITYHPFDVHSPKFSEAIRLYMTIFEKDNLASSQAFMYKYVLFDDWYGMLAVQGERVIGLAFGTKSEAGQWWHDRVSQQVGAYHPALQNAWVLIQLGVLDGYRNQGIGKHLHDEVIARQPYQNLLLSTPVANIAAQRFYLRYGWWLLHPGFMFTHGQEPFLVMAKRLV